MTLPFENDTNAVVKKLAKQNIKANQRTALSIMSAILIAATFLCTLCTLTQSWWNQRVQQEIFDSGDWDAQILELQANQIELIKNNDNIKDVMVKGNNQTFLLSFKENDSYLLVQNCDEQYWESMHEKNLIMRGRVPKAPGEIVVGKKFFEDNPSVKIGDTIDLELGERKKDNRIVDFLSPFQDGEVFVKTDKVQYTIVGEIDRTVSSAYNGWDKYSVSKIMEDSFELLKLAELKDVEIEYYTWSRSQSEKSVNNFQEVFKRYYERIKNFQFVQEKGVSSIKGEIEDLKKNVHELSGWSLKKLIEEFGVHNILSEKVAENKLLVFMLRRGYIDEKYANYINYFKGTSITKEDMNYILAVKNMEKLPYNYNLTKVGMVIQRLQPYEFEQKSIFNFILLEYLLSEENDDEKRMILIDQLSDRTVESWEFIDEFIEQTQYKARLIQLLAMRWPDMWNDIVQDISITYERKIFYLQLLIDNVDTERLFVLNDNNKMSGFIEENPDILQQLSSIQDQKVISLIETLGIVFTNVSIANVSEEVLRYVFENQRYELNGTMIRRIVEFEDGTMLSGLDTRNYTTIISLGYEPLIKYIQENLKQYVKEIILAPNNTKEDVEQIMDLLERMLENAPEETEICLELVNHEEFCVDDISECCGKFNSDFDKDVKILWDELLDKGKVSLKWENIKCYWDRYKITPELLQYIETNSDQLTFLENQCLNEVFAEELITSTIDDSAFEKLLPQLELEFDIPIEKVERQKVGILIKKKYIPFDVNKYGEIKDAYPDLCPDFILYNQAEYMEVMEKIPMGETLLETLLLSPILDFSNAEVLLDAFGENYMTAKIAENLVDSNVTINKSIFTAAWEYVDEKGKKTLMFKCLSILEAADFENCFSELSQWYSGFCDRSKKHSVELPNNEESQRLAKRLQEVSYITSYKLQEKEVYDSVTETKKKKSTFVCWIKAIKG